MKIIAIPAKDVGGIDEVKMPFPFLKVGDNADIDCPFGQEAGGWSKSGIEFRVYAIVDDVVAAVWHHVCYLGASRLVKFLAAIYELYISWLSAEYPPYRWIVHREVCMTNHRDIEQVCSRHNSASDKQIACVN